MPKPPRPRGLQHRPGASIRSATDTSSTTKGLSRHTEEPATSPTVPIERPDDDSIPPLPRELYAHRADARPITWAQLKSVWGWIVGLATFVAAVVALAMYVARLDTKVDYAIDGQKNLQQRTDQILQDSARNAVRLEGIESRLQKFETREDPNQASKRQSSARKGS